MAVGTSALLPSSESEPAAVGVAPSSELVTDGEEALLELVEVEDFLFFSSFVSCLVFSLDFSTFSASLADADVLPEADVLADEDSLAGLVASPSSDDPAVDRPVDVLFRVVSALSCPVVAPEPPVRGVEFDLGAEDVVLAVGFGVGFAVGAATVGGGVPGAPPAPRLAPTTLPGAGS